MKHIFYFILFTILLSCNVSKNGDIKNKTICNNEKELVINPKSNWRIPLERINNIDDYISECQTELKKSNDGEKEKTKYGISVYSNIYPYILVDSVKIGLMPLRRNTGAGYRLNNNNYIITIGDDNNSNKNRPQEVFKFYQTAHPIIDKESDMKLVYPRIDVTIISDHFDKIENIFKEILFGYLKAVRLFSEKTFSKNICDLNKTEMEILKSKFKLNIRLYKRG